MQPALVTQKEAESRFEPRSFWNQSLGVKWGTSGKLGGRIGKLSRGHIGQGLKCQEMEFSVFHKTIC